MAGKRYKVAQEKVNTVASPTSLADAVRLLKSITPAKFDETVEIHIRLGVDPKKSDQMVRGQIVYPHGTPRAKKIMVFVADSAQQKDVLQAGAVTAGGDELIAKIADGDNIDADITVATPDMMPKVAKVARILGPKGLMPNPKTGTVTPDPVATVKELMGGKVSFKMDQLGNMHEAVAKISWEDNKIIDNTEALINAVKSAKLSTSRGQFIKKIALKSTMSPAIFIDVSPKKSQ